MSERLPQLEQELAFWNRRKTLAAQAVIESNEHIVELEAEKRQLLGGTAVRHLYAVPDLPPLELSPPNGAA